MTALQNLAVCEVLGGEIGDGASRLETVIAKCPNHPAAWLNLGVLKHLLGEDDEALVSYNRTIQNLTLGTLQGTLNLKFREGSSDGTERGTGLAVARLDDSARGGRERRMLVASVRCAKAAWLMLHARSESESLTRPESETAWNSLALCP